MKSEQTFVIKEEDVEKRLDKFLSGNCLDLSRTFIQKLITEQNIKVNNKQVKSGYKLKENDKISVVAIHELPLEQLKIRPEKIKLDIAFEDKDLIVINKPQGMVTHPASSIYKGTLVNALLYHCKDSLSGINGVTRPGIVHRLDKDTSGLIIVCKNDKSHNDIAKQIQERKLKRHYLAIVHGVVKYDRGTINKPIGRHKIHRTKMAIVQGGRSAITHWKILKKLEKYTFLECTLETGRTHQIRVHMLSIGHPIVGDSVYSKKNDEIEYMLLHAYKLIFTHPKTKKEVHLETDIPKRFKAFLENNNAK